MKKKLQSIKQDFLLYTSPNGEIKVSVLLQNETIWLNAHQMATLFDIDRTGVVRHLKNIYETGELDINSTCAKIAQVAKDGKNRVMDFYNLDAIISVGYRVNSFRGTQFRIWATKQLKELIIKGFVLDEEKLKNPENPFGTDYFEQLEEKIADIRTSERRFYQKITDIYALSVDYDKSSNLTKNFFATVQNKLHFGIHGKTAAELINDRADISKRNMGITCISQNELKKSDVFVAKNYLTEKEISQLNLIVEQYLAFAKFQAQQKKAMTMNDWILKLDDFLRLNEREILQHKGKITKQLADAKAERIYDDFKVEKMKNYESDFDKSTKKLLQSKKEK
ncbi:MAG: virulence RhuM family protein [Candidatus Marinimicrobia bacterium]|nr:virulence RhuM family protein [Candidatus Neomarinimicrobiota bacterium]